MKRSTVVRKISLVLRAFEERCLSGKKETVHPANVGGRAAPDIRFSHDDRAYILSLLDILLSEDDFDPRIQRVIEKQRSLLWNINNHPGNGEVPELAREKIIRICNTVRHLLLQATGAGPGDWDLNERRKSRNSLRESGSVYRARVFLEDMRSPYNVGSVFRTAESFKVEQIFLTDSCPSPENTRAKRASMGCTAIVPWRRAHLKDISSLGGLFALELGGSDLRDFSFPETGMVILGNEELGISPEAKDLACRQGLGLVSIPTFGVKGSLNVSSAFAILLHAWHEHLRGAPNRDT